MTMVELAYMRMDSPVGELLIACSDTALQVLDYIDYADRMHHLLQRRYGTTYRLTEAHNPLDMRTRMQAYFAGDLTAINDIPVETGGTPFQQRVWSALRTIPAGQVATYSIQATRIGQPTASRAVGRTNGLNPVAIVLPCHRVIGSNAKLTGYAGGLWRKEWLLRHEGWAGAIGQSTLSL
jgi:methylated-DNA-[protein]-cysteine S-methyltransferase